MRWSDLPLSPSERTLRQFAGLWLGFFGGLAGWHGLVRGHGTAGWVLAGLALALGPLGLIRPKAVRPVFVAWVVLTYPVGVLVSLVMLGLVYYGMLTPLGGLLRLAGRDPLRRQRPSGEATYWEARPAAAEPRRYLSQF